MNKEKCIETRIETGEIIPVLGIDSFYKSERFEANDKSGAYIDKHIANIIILLNQLNCSTWVSCSGIDEDHIFSWSSGAGYISFRKITKDVEDILYKYGWINDNPAWDNSYYCRIEGNGERKESLVKIEEELTKLR